MPPDLAAGPFAEFALILGLTAIVGAIATRLRQPVLMAYIVVGILTGPAAFDIVGAHDQINLLAQVGVAVLLFVVGLKLDLAHVRQVGRVALATGLGQLTFTILLGFLLLLALGKGVIEALYVGVALTFSSTIIVVKLLSDKRQLDSLHGHIAVGFLIVQDIAVVLAMMAMGALRGVSELGELQVGLSLIGRIAVAGVVLLGLMRYVLPSVVRAMARSQELLLLFAIAWGTGLAALGEWIGFSKEAGAFLAGFSLASTPYREAMGARLTAVRDFLLLFFFIDLGSRLDFSTFGGQLWPAALLSVFVLIGNPLIVMAIIGFMGYRKRTGFFAGLTVAQISEFSIVFVAMGVSMGHVGQEALGLTTLVGIVTIASSTYMILYAQPLYDRLAPWLGPFERKHPHREIALEQSSKGESAPHVIIIGLGRFGGPLARRLQAAGLRVLGVDFDPEIVRGEHRPELPIRFGDAQDGDFIETLPLAGVAWIVSTLPDEAGNHALLLALDAVHFEGQVVIVARDEEHKYMDLRDRSGVTVHYPIRDAIEYVGERLSEQILARASAPPIPRADPAN